MEHQPTPFEFEIEGIEIPNQFMDGNITDDCLIDCLVGRQIISKLNPEIQPGQKSGITRSDNIIYKLILEEDIDKIFPAYSTQKPIPDNIKEKLKKKSQELKILIGKSELKSIFTYDKDHDILKLNLIQNNLGILISLVNTFLDLENDREKLEYFNKLSEEELLSKYSYNKLEIINNDNYTDYIPLLIRTLAEIFLTVDITTGTGTGTGKGLGTGGGKSNFFLKNQKKKTIKKKKTSKKKKSSNKSKKKNKNKKRLSRKRNRKIQNKIGNMVGGDIELVDNSKFEELSVDPRRSVYAVTLDGNAFSVDEPRTHVLKIQQDKDRFQPMFKKIKCFDARTKLTDDEKNYNHSNGPYVYEARIYHKLKDLTQDGKIIDLTKDGKIIGTSSLVDIHSYMYMDKGGKQINPPLDVKTLYKSLKEVKKKGKIKAALITEKTDGFTTVYQFFLKQGYSPRDYKDDELKNTIQQLQIDMLREMFFNYGFVHLDFHRSNCLIKDNGNSNIELKLFDFDFSAIYGFTKLNTFELDTKEIFSNESFNYKPHEDNLKSEQIFMYTRFIIYKNTQLDLKEKAPLYLNEEGSLDLNVEGFYVLGHFYDLYYITSRQCYNFSSIQDILLDLIMNCEKSHIKIIRILPKQTEFILGSIFKIQEGNFVNKTKLNFQNGLNNLYDIACKLFLDDDKNIDEEKREQLFQENKSCRWFTQVNICNLYIIAHILDHIINEDRNNVKLQKPEPLEGFKLTDTLIKNTIKKKLSDKKIRLVWGREVTA